MSTPSPSSPLSRRVTAVVPRLAGWRSVRGAWLNLLAFGLTVLAATWMVHQTEYFLEYGRRLPAVMAASPHRLYMAPLGVVLAAALGCLLALVLLVLAMARSRVGDLERRLPPRLARSITAPRPAIAPRRILVTAGVLAGSQMALYLLQENLESLAAFGTLPGLAVLLAAQHLTVIPLHLLAGLLGSLLLWTAAGWMRQSRQTAQRARVLAGLALSEEGCSRRTPSPSRHLPSYRLDAGSLGLRSPPLPA